MHRRQFLLKSLAGILAAPLAAEAQPGERIYRLGLLDYSSPDAARQAQWDAFRQQLRILDYIEGRNLALERRWGQGTTLDC